MFSIRVTSYLIITAVDDIYYELEQWLLLVTFTLLDLKHTVQTGRNCGYLFLVCIIKNKLKRKHTVTDYCFSCHYTIGLK